MLDLLLLLPCLVLALALRPWRSLGADGPPSSWFVWWLVLPLFWGADRYVDSAVLQPLSGAPLLVLMAGWPLAVLALLPTALLTAWLADLDGWQALHRLVWLGLVPGSLTVLLGAAVRRLLPHHLFVYILARGFFVPQLACTLAGAAALVLEVGVGLGPSGAAVVAGAIGGVATAVGVAGDLGGLDPQDVMVARLLAASGEAFLTGMLVAIFVAFRPQWLATYSDRLYLPPRGP
jgi:uncharacterized membrane protein